MRRQAGYARVATGIGDRMKQVREAFGERQADVADGIGVAASAVAAWELERNIINVPALIQIAARYGVSLTWLATGRGPMFEDAGTERLVVLGDPRRADPCRAAMSFLMDSPVSLTGVVIQRDDGGEIRWGWVVRQPNLEGFVGLVLPGERVRDGQERTERRWVASGHKLMGVRALSKEEAGRMKRMKAGVVSDPDLVRRWREMVEAPW